MLLATPPFLATKIATVSDRLIKTQDANLFQQGGEIRDVVIAIGVIAFQQPASLQIIF